MRQIQNYLEKKTTNIASDIQAIGINYGYKFDDNWSANLAYSHAKSSIDKKMNTSSRCFI